MDVVTRTNIPGLPLFKRGKVRDVYDAGDSLLFVSTDRVSVFDVVLPTPIPGKGVILTRVSNFWFNFTKGIMRNHVRETRAESMPEAVRSLPFIARRSVLVRKLRMLPIECVVRGYLAGSAWSEYRESGSVCGIPLARGLRESEKLADPLFTPATKAEEGHDENISFARVSEIVGRETAEQLRESSIRVYERAEAHARARGLILADTKFEFGMDEEGLVLADEAMTPDSSRYWMASEYAVGKPQMNFDKQGVRDYAASLGWNKMPPGPELPQSLVEETTRKYESAFEMLTGEPRSSLERSNP